MLLDQSIAQEDIVNNMENSERVINSVLWKNSKWLSMEWLWHCRVKPVCCRITAVFCMIFGILIVLGEITLFIDEPIGLLPMLFEEDYGSALTQLYVIIPLAFVCFNANYAIFSLKLTGFFGLYGNNQTDPSNLAWAAYFMARITPALSYNFLLLIKVTGTQF